MPRGRRLLGAAVGAAAVFYVGLLLFLDGFFLTRRELGLRASIDQDCTLEEVLTSRSGSSTCGMSYPAQRSVWLFVIDGLRLDFLNTTTNHNFPFLHELLVENSSQSLLFGFLADPPTVTAQRLKGLMTGTLPTFIDVGSNLNSSAIVDDNLLDQLVATIPDHQRVVLGDDTWVSLFPSQFHRAEVFDSFNTKDLDTVDDGIMQYLPALLKTLRWRFMVTHFLGVDHIGHTHNASHPLMRQRLQRMDAILQKAIHALPEDAVVLVCGDHGMTDAGEHGGSSDEELRSALFVYSKQPFDLDPVGLTPREFTTVMPQVDIVPSLAALLNVPIPFSSIGKVQLALFPRELRLGLLSKNALQVWRYLCAYYAGEWQDTLLAPLLHQPSSCESLVACAAEMEQSLQSLRGGGEAEHWLAHLRDDLLIALHQHLELLRVGTVDDEGGSRAAASYTSFLTNVQETARRTWVEFKPITAMSGLLAMLVAVAGAAVLLATHAPMSRTHGAGAIVACGALAFYSTSGLSNSFVIREAQVVFLILQLLHWQSNSRGRMFSWVMLLTTSRVLHGKAWETYSHAASLLHLAACVVLSSCWLAEEPRQGLPTRSRRWLYLAIQVCVILQHQRAQVVSGWVVGVVLVGVLLLIIDAMRRGTWHQRAGALVGAVHCLTSLFVVSPGHWLATDGALIVLQLSLPHVLEATALPTPLTRATYCAVWGRWLFFLTDHALQFDKLHLSVAFVGKATFDFRYAFAALLVNTSAADLLALLGVARGGADLSDAIISVAGLLAFRMVTTLMSCTAAWALREHLMLWAVFAPKVVFEVVLLAALSVLALALLAAGALLTDPNSDLH